MPEDAFWSASAESSFMRKGKHCKCTRDGRVVELEQQLSGLPIWWMYRSMARMQTICEFVHFRILLQWRSSTDWLSQNRKRCTLYLYGFCSVRSLMAVKVDGKHYCTSLRHLKYSLGRQFHPRALHSSPQLRDTRTELDLLQWGDHWRYMLFPCIQHTSVRINISKTWWGNAYLWYYHLRT